ncbi:MAG TPA: dienelactone hydrolase family protein [Chloroflexia bacterium]|nr:dienelactone hydrolase family protein [Chloroflexia bacterium]
MTDQPTMHQGMPVYGYGAAPDKATVAMIMVHGRGAAPADILSLAEQLDHPEVAYLAPEAATGQWYPYPFIAPVEQNEPWLSSALAAVGEVFDMVASVGIPPERTLLLGFSQGACLALEYAARNPRRYAGVIGLSGALIENGDKPRDYGDAGSMEGTPVFLGCSDNDPHIPEGRLTRTAGLLEELDAQVVLHIYPDMGHTVIMDEITFVRGMIEAVVAESGAGD